MVVLVVFSDEIILILLFYFVGKQIQFNITDIQKNVRTINIWTTISDHHHSSLLFRGYSNAISYKIYSRIPPKGISLIVTGYMKKKKLKRHLSLLFRKTIAPGLSHPARSMQIIINK